MLLNRKSLSRFFWIAIAFIATNVATFLGAYIAFDTNIGELLRSEIQSVRVEIAKTNEEVNRQAALIRTEEMRVAILDTIRQKSVKAGDRLSIEQIGEITDVVMETYKIHGIKPSLAISIMEVESTFNPRAVSSARAKGLMQVMDATARPYLANYNISWNKEVLFDPVINVRIALDYLRDLHEDHVADGLELEDEYTTSLLRYSMSQAALDRLIKSQTGMQYKAKISQVQSELIKQGIV